MLCGRVAGVSDEVRAIVTAYFKGPVGLSFFVAWISCAFYSGIVWNGGDGLMGEYPMVVSMAVSGFIGLALVVALGRRTSVSRWWRPWMAWVASALCGLGVVLVAASPTGLYAMAAAGAVVMAVGFSVLTLSWGSRVSFLDERLIEFSVPASFIFARVLFFAVSLLKPQIAVGCVVVLPFVSAALLGRGVGAGEFERFTGQPEPELRAGREAGVAAGRSEKVCAPESAETLGAVPGTWATVGILLLLRIGYSLVRSMASETAGSGMAYCLFRFVVPVLAFGLFVAVALRAARAINVRLAVVWCLPLVLLAGALLPLDGIEGFSLASAVNTAASLCMQTFFWIVLAKAGHRRLGSGTFYFACYLGGLCLGIAGGSMLGAAFATVWGGEMVVTAIQVCLALIAAGTLALERGASQLSVQPSLQREACAEISSSADGLRAAVESQARQISEVYRLTNREREVLEYLLAGYNRPYIRDHLYISLNTVGTHIRSIFVKLDVHSQQELMDFARTRYTR